jgi:hypothetical protein
MTIFDSTSSMNGFSAESSISFFLSTIPGFVPLKSNGLASSYLAMFTAFSISIELTWLTISIDGMAAS